MKLKCQGKGEMGNEEILNFSADPSSTEDKLSVVRCICTVIEVWYGNKLHFSDIHPYVDSTVGEPQDVLASPVYFYRCEVINFFFLQFTRKSKQKSLSTKF
jgi:hypothetical protein